MSISDQLLKMLKDKYNKDEHKESMQETAELYEQVSKMVKKIKPREYAGHTEEPDIK